LGRRGEDKKDRIVIHAGDRLFVDGAEQALGTLRSRYIYEAGEELGINVTNPLRATEAKKLVDMLKLVRWEREINAYLLAGWCVVAPVCGALKWRPHIWVTGGAGTGKSWLFKEVVRPLLGETGLAVQSETTEAGIRTDFTT
jgi:putative DNA primase/helicase